MATAAPTANRILGALPAAELARLAPHLAPTALPAQEVLFEAGQPITDVWFPLHGVVSLLALLEGGSCVEVANVGSEGIVGVPLAPQGSLGVRAVVEIAGAALRMPAPALVAEVDRAGRLATLVRRYAQALFSQVAQGAACNRLHSNEERLARWLLMGDDRADGDGFSVTHEVLAQMLGSRRATVTHSAGLLQEAGLVAYRRGRVTILDRTGLEGAACECYATVRGQLDAVLG